MLFLTTSELRRPEAWKTVHDDKALVTNHGKPVALMLPVTNDDFEETVDLINQVEAMRALAWAQADARKAGAGDLTLDEINAEIAAARKDRSTKRSQHATRRA